MTNQLKRMIAKVELLSEEDQDALAAIIERELTDKQHWAELFTDPRSDRALDDLAAEALAEAAHGEMQLSTQRLSIAEEISQDRGA